MARTQECASECPHVAKLAANTKSTVSWQNLAGWAAVLLTMLAMLWNMGQTLGEIKEKQVATDSKVDMILNAFHLVPSSPNAAPTNASTRTEQ